MGKGADYDWDRAAGGVDTYMAEREREILERVVPRLLPGGVPRYLDFACGTGRITWVIEPVARESYGIDLSAIMVAEARSKCAQTRFLGKA